jgi:hypothetical protein
MTIGPGHPSPVEHLAQWNYFHPKTNQADTPTDCFVFAVVSSVTLMTVAMCAAYAVGEAAGMSL